MNKLTFACTNNLNDKKESPIMIRAALLLDVLLL